MSIDQAIANLVQRGAVISTEPGGFPIVVGLIRRIGPERWFWWQAGAETEFGGHIVSGEHKIYHGGIGIEWSGNDRYAYLTSIEQGFEDAEEIADASKAWNEWQASYESNARLRRFIEREIQFR